MKKKENDRFVISATNSGVCNRIKNIISAIRLANELSRKPMIFWKKNKSINCEFSDLFNNHLEILNERQYKNILEYEDWKEIYEFRRKFPNKKFLILKTWRLSTFPGELDNHRTKPFSTIKGNKIDFEYTKIPEAVRKKFLRIIDRLNPVDYIKNEVEEFMNNFNDDTISVHVRSWYDSNSRTCYFNRDEYYEIMDKYPGSDFFLSCDSPKVLQPFIERYGERVLWYPKRTFDGDRDTKIGMQDTLVDLYLLSKNKKIITTYMSTFSEMAWWMGNCRAQVEVACLNKKIRRETIRKENKKKIFIFFKNRFYKIFRKLRLQSAL